MDRRRVGAVHRNLRCYGMSAAPILRAVSVWMLSSSTPRTVMHPSTVLLAPLAAAGDAENLFRLCAHKRKLEGGTSYEMDRLWLHREVHCESKEDYGRSRYRRPFGFTALGVCPGVANAVPASPVTSGTPLPQDDGGWWGPRPWPRTRTLGRWGPGWGGPGWYGGGVNACISATGPWGYVTGSALHLSDDARDTPTDLGPCNSAL